MNRYGVAIAILALAAAVYYLYRTTKAEINELWYILVETVKMLYDVETEFKEIIEKMNALVSAGTQTEEQRECESDCTTATTQDTRTLR